MAFVTHLGMSFWSVSLSHVSFVLSVSLCQFLSVLSVLLVCEFVMSVCAVLCVHYSFVFRFRSSSETESEKWC